MKLDRNINKDGKGKYALIQLRKVDAGSEAEGLLLRLHELGCLEWGCVGKPDEFFVIKLRDKYAQEGLSAYSAAVAKDASKYANDEDKSRSIMQWAIQVQSLCQRAGILSEFCKDPD